jgi:hypothetical protein
MDTRAKIAAAGAAPALPPGTRVVSGYFDPLLRAHADQLAALRQGHPALAVVITDPLQPLLPARARAELVAALECVDAVFLAGGDAPTPHLRLEAHHDRLRDEFLRRVRARQS